MKINQCVMHPSNSYFQCQTEPMNPFSCKFFVEGGKTRFHECKWERFPDRCHNEEAHEEALIIKKIEDL